MAILGAVSLFMLGALGLQPSPPPSGPPLEYQVKAAYIFNFVNFTEWPAAALGASTNSFHICVAGNDPFGGALESTVKGETVQGHPIAVERVTLADKALECQVLFVASGDASQIMEMLRPLAALPILVIGESEAVSRNGGVVTFVVDQGHVRFDVNRKNAERRGVRLSSRLLRIARSVQ